MNRFFSIDTLRGLIMIIMALDHTIGAVAVNHPIEVNLPLVTQDGKPFTFPDGSKLERFPGYHSPVEQWSRLITHVCAPGFQLLAGVGLAISVTRARRRGVPQCSITRDLAIRGAVLIAIEYVLLCTFIYRAQFMFLVLCCIGSCTLCFLLLRFLPKHAIGLLGLAIIALAPAYCPAEAELSSGKTYLLDIWLSFTFGGWFMVLYPILPWLGCFALGWWIGMDLDERRDEASVNRQAANLVVAGLVLFFLGFTLRWSGWAYAERIPLDGAGPFDLGFWQFAKYPPSLVFLLLTLGVLLTGMGLLRPLDLRERVPGWCRFVSVYGRTALFYFVVHFFLLNVISFYLNITPNTPNDAEHRYSFATAYAIWATVVLLLWPVCRAYDNLRQMHRTVLRYF